MDLFETEEAAELRAQLEEARQQLEDMAAHCTDQAAVLKSYGFTSGDPSATLAQVIKRNWQAAALREAERDIHQWIQQQRHGGGGMSAQQCIANFLRWEAERIAR